MRTPLQTTLDHASERLPLLVVDDPIFEEHRSKGHHPERPERVEAARRAVLSSSARSKVTLTGRDATDEDLARAHAKAYVASIAALDGEVGSLDADTYVCPRSVAAARRAAGGGIALVEALCSGPSQRGVALVRPPGHHATHETGMGFCLFNNVAIAARFAVEKLGLARVAVVDWDVHHGNGTQDIFWNDPRVLYVSLHQHPLYPGTGSVEETGGSDARGYTVNVPLAEGATDEVYDAAFDRIVGPVLDLYAPELILVSAGFDAHARDPLAAMQLTEAAYARMTQTLTRAADATAGGRIALFLEGGYDLSALERSLAASIDVMLGAPVDPALGTPIPAEQSSALDRARREVRRTWGSL